ncbi:hypothetical protein PoB_006901500 [Plakobranchus ocellatus]|uniref:Uncharacterized protein n=1 Tax=Plakobranchus ocellatus TaxID=259542 RepID=A0AAV4DEU1_9GAST|nr:hypothetical protein PoB_006901500 [Plakobranchus ocellatus]
MAYPQQDDLGLSGPLSGQGAGGGARTPDRWKPTDLRADSLTTVPPPSPSTAAAAPRYLNIEEWLKYQAKQRKARKGENRSMKMNEASYNWFMPGMTHRSSLIPDHQRPGLTTLVFSISQDDSKTVSNLR